MNHNDRCDRCGAQAFVSVVLKAGDLRFCGHHYAKHEEALLSVSLAVVDERDRINGKPSISANV